LSLTKCFFSQDRPLTVAQRNFIEARIGALSTNSQRSVFYPNFLYREARPNVPNTELHNSFGRMQYAKNQNRMVISDVDFEACKGAIEAIGDVGTGNYNYLVNETCSINNNRVLTKYKKASYFHEADSYIAAGELCDLGGGCDEGVAGAAGALQTVLLNNISTEICFDLACGVRSINGWSNYHDGARKSQLHLIQSNFINPFEEVVPNDNINRLPLYTGIVHADPYCNILSKKVSYTDVSAGKRTVRDFNINKCSFGIEIGDSNYNISFCKM
jgi:hypothetical protein